MCQQHFNVSFKTYCTIEKNILYLYKIIYRISYIHSNLLFVVIFEYNYVEYLFLLFVNCKVIIII